MIYLDNQKLFPPSPNVKNSYMKYFDALSYDAPYQNSKELFSDIANAQEEISLALGLGPDAKFVLTSSGGESIAHMLTSVFTDHIYPTGKNQIITTNVENSDILLALDRYKQLGVDSEIVTVNSLGMITKEILQMYVSAKTALISLSWTMPLTGVVQPISEIAAFCSQKNILLHVDVSDAIGKSYLALQDLPIDFITFDGAKIGAPRSTGGLIIQRYRQCGALIPSPIEDRLRGGELDVCGLMGLNAALSQAIEKRDDICLEVALMRNQLETRLEEECGGYIFFKNSDRLPTTTIVAFPYVHAETLSYALAQENIYVSFGGGTQQRLEVLLGVCGIPSPLARSAIALSLSSVTSQEELDVFIEKLKAVLKRLRPTCEHLEEALAIDGYE